MNEEEGRLKAALHTARMKADDVLNSRDTEIRKINARFREALIEAAREYALAEKALRDYRGKQAKNEKED